MRIYTKTGDRGETGLLGGKRVSKSDLRIEAIGALDELNAAIGILRAQKPDKKTGIILKQIQNDIFNIGAEIADSRPRAARLSRKTASANVKILERTIDKIEKKLPPLRNFILPGSTLFAAHGHMARTVCRRAERTFVSLNEKMPQNPHILKYINRLSDLLFMLAREDNANAGEPETLWKNK